MEPCIQMGISFLLLCFSLLTSVICKASSDNNFALFHFSFLGMVLDIASCSMLWNSIHSSSGTLSDLIPWICLMLSLYNHKGFDLVHNWVVQFFFFFFANFFNFNLNFAIRCLWSDSQLGSGLVLLECIQILCLQRQKYNQFDFGIDHLVMSMCRVVCCVVASGCLLWLVCSLGKTILAFTLLHCVLQGQTCCYSGFLLTSYSCIPVTYDESDIFSWCWFILVL